MKNVSREQLEVGMVVARDVVDRSGQVLVPAGTPLAERELRVLRSWGVSTVCIEASSGEAGNDPGEGAPTAEEQRIRERFRHTDLGHPFVQELFAQACLRAQRRHEQGRADEA